MNEKDKEAVINHYLYNYIWIIIIVIFWIKIILHRGREEKIKKYVNIEFPSWTEKRFMANSQWGKERNERISKLL